jgi:hypothetical protein
LPALLLRSAAVASHQVIKLNAKVRNSFVTYPPCIKE